ncbi:MAG: hypothetical protein WD266_01915 [Balneolales bacterium]
MASSLSERLGIKPGQTVSVINAPAYYLPAMGKLPDNAMLSEEPVGKFDFVQLFARNLDELTRLAPNAISVLKPRATFWVSYPKQSAQVQTDITRDVGWDVIYDHKLEPIDHIDLDDLWSARRFRQSDPAGT